MCHIQQLGSFLDFIDHHGMAARHSGDTLPQALRPGQKGTQHVGSEQVDVHGIRKNLVKPGGLAGATRTEQKEALGWWLQKSLNNRHFRSRNGVFSAILPKVV